MTNNFNNIIGGGGFGKVYLGTLEETQVAVKLLSPSSKQGYKEFRAEVKHDTIVFFSIISNWEKLTNALRVLF